ncbi:MAG: hypothetical protein QUS33_04310 [Dehalococcoidia bacterium]|nr:hypothetical protein [Dehalococcoidia bacterium]
MKGYPAAKRHANNLGGFDTKLPKYLVQPPCVIAGGISRSGACALPEITDCV